MTKSMKEAMAFFEKLGMVCNRSNVISFKVNLASSNFTNVIGAGFDKTEFNVSLDLSYAIVYCTRTGITAKRLAASPVEHKYGCGKTFDAAVENLLLKILSPGNTFIQIVDQSIYVVYWDDAKKHFKKEIANL